MTCAVGHEYDGKRCRECHLERKREHYRANKAQYIARARVWAKTNRARHAELMHDYKQERRTDPAYRDAENARKRASRARHPERDRGRTPDRGHRRRARKRQATVNPFTPAQWQAVVDFYGGRCAYCETGTYEHDEHVVPLSKGGDHALHNLVPACKTCNQRKFTKTWEPRVRHPWMVQP